MPFPYMVGAAIFVVFLGVLVGKLLKRRCTGTLLRKRRGNSSAEQVVA